MLCKITLIIILLIFNACGVNQKKEVSIIEHETGIIADSIVEPDRILLIYGDDSISITRIFSGNKEVIYTGIIPDGGIHYKTYDQYNNHTRTAYTIHRVLVDTTVDYLNIYHLSDSVVSYQNGKVYQIDLVGYTDEEGYKKLENEIAIYSLSFDSIGNLQYKTISDNGSSLAGIHESYHANGKISGRWVQGFVNGGGMLLESAQWDTEGNKIEESKYEHSLLTGKTGYDNTFIVCTTTEYYPNGSKKLVKRLKSFTESEECPCGKWIYYDQKGKIENTEQYKPCNNFELDCIGLED